MYLSIRGLKEVAENFIGTKPKFPTECAESKYNDNLFPLSKATEVTGILKGIHTNFCWFEDFKVGQVFEFGSFQMTKENMLTFARAYDPEPFHMDEEKAVELGWDGLIASGPQVVAICRRLQTDGFPNAEVVISPGWDEIRWLKPVLAGDVLSCRSEFTKAKTMASRPGEGLLQLANSILNQKGEVVSSMVSNWFIRCRPQD